MHPSLCVTAPTLHLAGYHYCVRSVLNPFHFSGLHRRNRDWPPRANGGSEKASQQKSGQSDCQEKSLNSNGPVRINMRVWPKVDSETELAACGATRPLALPCPQPALPLFSAQWD